MSDSESRSCGLLLSLFALVVFSAPSCAFAQPFLELHNDSGSSPAHETGQQTTKRSVTIGLNENRNLMIRHSDLSLIMAYNPSNEIFDHQERIRTAQRQNYPVVSGISLLVSLLF